MRGAEGRGLRGCTARAPSRAWGPVPARAAWKAAGCSGPAGGSAEATGPLREGGSVPLRASPLRPASVAGAPRGPGAGRWGDTGGRRGRGGREAGPWSGWRCGPHWGVQRPPRSQGGEVGARVGSSPAEMRALLGLALRGRLEYFSHAGLHTLVGFSTRAGLFRFPFAAPSDLDL